MKTMTTLTNYCSPKRQFKVFAVEYSLNRRTMVILAILHHKYFKVQEVSQMRRQKYPNRVKLTAALAPSRTRLRGFYMISSEKSE